MKRKFEFARKIETVDGKKVICVDHATGEPIKAYENARIPEYQTMNSAGADFFCAKEVQIPSIWAGVGRVLLATGEGLFLRLFTNTDANTVKSALEGLQPTMVHTGIKASMYCDEVLELYNRSSNPKKMGLVLANGVGVVDADFYENVDDDGEIRFAFYNFLPWTVTVKVGDRIGQGVFKKFLRPQVNCIIKDAVREGGFGSTDNK